MTPQPPSQLRSERDPSAGRRSRSAPRSVARARGGRRLLCRLTALHPERALSLARVQHLAQELPDIDFTLEDRPDIDVIWACGYERGNPAQIRLLRAHHPHTLLLVTAKEHEDLWTDEVRAAGADSALSWPIDLERLNRLLHRRRLQRA